MILLAFTEFAAATRDEMRAGQRCRWQSMRCIRLHPSSKTAI